MSRYAFMLLMPADKKSLRIYLTSDIEKILRVLSAIKNQSISETVQIALEEHFAKPDNQDLIDRHKIDEIEEN
ncbi:hypothetical protein [Leptolyngbya sp. 7M]|uniref:hypothetical protein n=1 Tax=Leptolyngbya sp. 7M TaxID=2812896 RepID=UPI001B8B6C78|nr:hypothetical protein [Leptolyngbya sp. 7M]QYO63212.1 hypothetical protein JVX88_25180 [Leptolyngbya sp. 7M]